MAMTLAEFLTRFPDQHPTQVETSLRSLVRSASRDAPTLTALAREIDAALDDTKITSYYYGFAMRVSQSLKWALESLRSRREPAALDAAVDVLAFNLRQSTDAALAQLGGLGALVTFLDRELTFASAKRLFKELSARSPPPALAAVNDALLGAAFAFPGAAAAQPLNRLAPVLAQTLVTACSPNIVRNILPRVAQLISPSSWRKIVERHPELIEELVFIQLGDTPAPNDWENGGVLEQPSFLAPCVGLLMKSGGQAFFRKFVRAYAARTAGQRPDVPQQDVLGVATSRIVVLDRYMRYYLESYTESAARVAEVLSVLSAFRTLREAEGNVTGWDLVHVTQTLLVAVKEFARRPDLWEPTLERPDHASDDVISALQLLFKGTRPGQLTIPTIVQTCQLAKQPRAARLPVVAVAYATIGMPLTMPPDASAVDKFPTCPVQCMVTFHPPHCKRFLDIGLDAKGAAFIAPLYTRYGGPKIPYSYVRASGDGLDEFTGDDLQYTCMALIRAARVGAQRGALGDQSPSQDGVADFRKDVDHFVQLAAKSTSAASRSSYITQALRLCIVAQSPLQFLVTFQAAALRYAKDPEVGPDLLDELTQKASLDFLSGPGGLYVTRSRPQPALVDALRTWTKTASDILMAMLEMIKTMVFNPDVQANSSYQQFGRTLGDILRRRIQRVRVLYPVLTPDLHGAVAILLRPLTDVVLAWDRLKVIDHPTSLGFNWRNCVPMVLSSTSLAVEPRLGDAVLKCLSELGEARMKLYSKGRDRLGPGTFDGEPPMYDSAGDVYSFLPLDVAVTGSGETSRPRTGLDRLYCGLKAPSLLKAYCEHVLFSPLTKKQALKPALGTTDSYHFHHSQFERALTDFLYYSVDATEVAGKIERLFQHYSTAEDDKENFMFLVARHETVRIMVWASPQLQRFVESWLPSSLWSGEHLDNKQPTYANPLMSFPVKPFARRRGGDPTLLEARNRRAHESEVLASTISPFYQRSSGYFAKLRLSLTFTRRLGAFAASWLLTSGGVPTPASPPPEDIVQVALTKVRFHSTFMDIHPKNSRLLAALVTSTIDSLSDDDVASMIGALFSVPDNGVAHKLAFSCVRIARHVRPHMVANRASEIIVNPEFSAWHRQAVCASLLSAMKQDVALDFAKNLIGIIGKGVVADRERRKGLSPDEQKDFTPSIKVTTVKMIVDVIGEALSLGVLSSNHVGLLQSAQAVLPHNSVQVQVVQALGQLTLRDYLFSPGTPSPALQALRAQVKTGTQLAEGRGVSDADWNNMAEGAKSNIKLEAEHPVAATLLRAPVTSFPVALARSYCLQIITPCLLGQIANRTKWLRAAVAREGASFDIEATYDYEFDAASLYKGCSRFLRYPPFAPAGSEPSSILDLVQRRATLFLNREPYHELLRLVKVHHPDDWQTSDYGKTVAALCAHATRDDAPAFSAAMGALAHALLSNDLPSEAVELAKSAVTRIGEELLKPENATACFSPPPARSNDPFTPFTSFLAHLSYAPAGDRGTWDERIRPIIQQLVETAEAHARVFKGARHNRTALYDVCILHLKLLLLPHPAYAPFVQQEGRHQNWVDALGQLVSDVLSQPSYHRLFPGHFSAFIAKSNRMNGDDALAAVQLLLAKGDSTLRAPCVELAVTLANNYKQDITGSAADRTRFESIRNELLGSEDGIVQALAFRL
ncbi:hypothetical protein AURDEDRAFT_110806 [Auricularia subglabra TFB-10046 SS5]|nr:hypothetical protein AURDEDRAFT_110806 [Auricularia subglabra TFB-10046 SS5]